MNTFDPSYGYDLSTLLAVEAPIAPEGFADFWRGCFEKTQKLKPLPEMKHTGRQVGAFDLYDLTFQSTNEITIHGWVLLPTENPVNKVLVIGHGYGGCNAPNGQVPLLDCAYVYLCYRGLSRSRIEGIPDAPNYHVLYNIHDRDQYIMRGCVEDTWLAVSAATVLFPDAKDHIGFMGISFSGGIGALALPWDARIRKAHLEVPTFGHQRLRVTLPSLGSAGAVQGFYANHPDVLNTLDFYDAAIAARYIQVPVHIAAALADGYVAPPGQFAIYNSLSADRDLFVLEKGHAQYPNHAQQQADLLTKLSTFFADL
jgi:cephalosporin-C deacetylase